MHPTTAQRSTREAQSGDGPVNSQFTLVCDLQIARRVRLHQTIRPDDPVLAVERTVTQLLERLAALADEGHPIVTDDGRYSITVRRINPPHNLEGNTTHGKN